MAKTTIAVRYESVDWATLHFPYNAEIIAALKMMPGAKWDPALKCWRVPTHLHAVLGHHLSGLAELRVVKQPSPPALAAAARAPLAAQLLQPLRPYQQQAVELLLSRPSYMLTFQQRVGKTPPAAVAAALAMAEGHVKTLLITYPNGVAAEWARQLPQFSGGLGIVEVEGMQRWSEAAMQWLVSQPYLALGVSYELLDREVRGPDIENVLAARGAFGMVMDEVQNVQNRKAGRSEILRKLARAAAFRWGLTGTPQRNYPKNLWAIFDAVAPDSMGSYSKFGSRFCDAHEGDYGWEDDGESNAEELAARLAAISWRLTRRDVAQWLPATTRVTHLCDLPPELRTQYDAMEQTLGPQILAALNTDAASPKALAALKSLAKITSAGKGALLCDRIRDHQANQTKILVFAYNHDTLRSAEDAAEKAGLGPRFVAGGWMTADRRRKAIDQWKASPGPGVLFANMLSSGIGIDLSDAGVALFLELAWVPADFLQAESRVEDIHLGKRTTGALLEYLLVRNTVDADMAMKLIEKIGSVQRIVGKDADAEAVNTALRASGVVDRNVLTLTDTDPETISSALDSMLARIGISDRRSYVPEVVAADVAEYVDDELAEDRESDNEDGGAL